ncbi:NAD-dependent epimerase/dehydratase family protein [Candidatus Pelagibacter sp.]|uniref:NAD-dependent epimerase/dehydratase family protein n=1 Tax=Candidatus Pelagibacter sp. TaxID=2024849 RepID=UPI003F84D71C
MKNLIVVTGGAGFIGSNLIKFLTEKTNQKIISIDNYFSGSKKNHILHKNVKYIKGENLNISKLLKKYKRKIKIVFHFGEFSRIFKSFKYIDRCMYSNLMGTYEVVKFCSQNKIRIIYSASSSKFGNKGKDEHLSPYSWTKSKNIELIKNYSKWYSLKYEILYFYNVYGKGQIRDHEMAAVVGIFESQYLKNEKLTVVNPGNQKRDFTHIDDIVGGCYLAWKKGRQDDYLICSNKEYSILQVAKMFKRPIKFIPKRPGERLRSTKTNKKSLLHLGYKPKKNIKDYIKNFISNN